MQSVKSLPQVVLFGALSLALMVWSMRGERFSAMNYRALAIGITSLGLMVCTAGSVGYFVTRAPLHPLTILSGLLGIFALSAGVSAALGKSFWFVKSPSTAVHVVGAIIVIKFIVARVHTLIIS
jgi:hypothetical protein